MQGFSYIFYPNTTALHALVSLKAFWHIQLIQPQKLSFATATIALKPGHLVISLLPSMALSTN
jgi:hypothetical protein